MSDRQLHAAHNLTYGANDPELLFTFMGKYLIELKKWLNANKLKFNSVKIKRMFIVTRHKLSVILDKPDITINGEKISHDKIYKCLGLELDELLSWEAHVSNVVSKATKAIGMLRRLNPFQSILDFGILLANARAFYSG